MTARFLAFDLGAESGRAMLGTLDHGVLGVREIHRFLNEPVRQNGSLQWDILHLWQEMRRALELNDGARLDSIGVDSWGVDYALIGERGNLLENPYHYRDRRTNGAMEAVFERVSRERIYAITGIQFLPINTIYQLYAACRATPELIDAARALVTIPDLLNYWLTGALTAEYTVATTTQFIDARTRTWATRMLEEIGLPTRLLQPLVEPGTTIGPLQASVSATCAGTPVVAPACHDTASAVASVSASGNDRVPQLGHLVAARHRDVTQPVITARALALNFTNEGGVCGTTRLLKNIGGLWLLQSCRLHWRSQGQDLPYDALIAGAADERLAFRSLIDPDYPPFLNPTEHAGDDRGILPDDRPARAGRRRSPSPARFSKAWRSSTARSSNRSRS